MRLSVSNDLFAMTLLTSHWLFRDMACCGLKTLRTQLFCCSDYHIVYWTPHSVIYVPFVLTASLHIPKLLSWPLPVTRTLPVTWTLSVTWTSFMDLSSFVWHRLFVFTFCAYDQLIRHFSYLQHQWTSLFSLILLRALLWWHFSYLQRNELLCFPLFCWELCFDDTFGTASVTECGTYFTYLTAYYPFLHFLASSAVLRLSW